MITKLFSKLCLALLLGASLALTSGCGGSGGGGSAGVDPAEVSRLEALVAQGDANAAFKLAEMHAEKVGNREAQIEAAKWAHVAGRMGHDQAKMLLDTVSRGMEGDDALEAEQRVATVKFPPATQ